MKCFIRSLDDKSIDLYLEDKKEVQIGRVNNPKVFNKSCSRHQISICADYERKLAKIRCIGSNPSAIDSKLLYPLEEDNLFPDQTLFLVNKTYPMQILFLNDIENLNKRTKNSHCLSNFIDDSSPPKAKKLNNDVKSFACNNETIDSSKSVDVNENNDVSDRLMKFQELFKMKSSNVNVQEANKSSINSPPIGWSFESNVCLVYTFQTVKNSDKVAAFDLDFTLIATVSGRTFPKDSNDWRLWASEVPGQLKKLASDGYKLVVFSNQRWISTGKLAQKDLQKKVESICSKLNIPIQCFFAINDDNYRKPRVGMWELLELKYNGGVSIDRDQSFYIGDAAGRPANWEPKKKKDHSCSDRLFALNLGVPFFTPEEFFLKHKVVTDWVRPSFSPLALKATIQSQAKTEFFKKPTKIEVALLVGLPASGKSTIVKKAFIPMGYKSVSRDDLNTWQKCVSTCSNLLSGGDYVVVDNTNLDKVSRARYIEVAKSLKVPVRCFKMEVGAQHCLHNEKFRELIGANHAKISDMVFNQLKSKYVEPTMDEGFDDIIPVPFIPEFQNKEHEEIYFQYLLER